jgi:hypothetical protein
MAVQGKFSAWRSKIEGNRTGIYGLVAVVSKPRRMKVAPAAIRKATQ